MKLRTYIQISSVILVATVFACKQDQHRDEKVNGRLEIICKQEGITGNVRARNSVGVVIFKDTIIYSTEKIANCCGWFDELSLIQRHDTVSIIDLRKSDELVACDCNCLFELNIKLEKNYAKDKKVVFSIRP